MNFENINEFDWDSGNLNKNWIKHSVSTKECEEQFFNEPLIIRNDEKHSLSENRFYCLGRTNQFRKLFTVFTIRNNKIRVISSRPMNKKEKDIYENYT